MCGVGGIIAPYSTPVWRARTMNRLLEGAASRGHDATGVCFIDPEKGMQVIKDGKPAREFVRENSQYMEARKNFPSIVLGHARAATKRTQTGPENNKNNHPFFAPETKMAMIHNGLISNDDNWRDTCGQDGGIKNKPDSLVDSEIMLLAVESFYLNTEPDKRTVEDAIDDACYSIAGSYVLAFLKEDEPNKVRFVRHDNPLAFGWVPSQKAIIFGSTTEIVARALEDYKEHLEYFVETVRVPSIINDANEDTMVTIEILPEDSKVPFRVTQKFLDCAKNDQRARHYVHEEISETMVD